MMGASFNNKEKTSQVNSNLKHNESEKEHKVEVSNSNKYKNERIEKTNESVKDVKSHKKGILIFI
jgi:hypothetical protein